MTDPDAIMTRVGRGLELAGHGERDAARHLLHDVWQEVGPTGDAFHRCAVAHHLADLQDEPEDALVWDLRALEAAQQLSDARATAGGLQSSVASLFPSLHLNVGEVYRKLGRPNEARDHLQAGLAAVDALPSDGYGAMIKRGLEGLRERLDAA